MNLIRFETPGFSLRPFSQCSTLTDEVSRLLNFPFLGRPNRFAPSGWVPAFDLHEDKDKLTIRAELPGLKKDQIQLTLKKGVLMIAGERKPETDTPGSDQIRRERVFGPFERSITLPFAVNETGILAAYEDGILTITLPKAEEAKPRQILVN